MANDVRFDPTGDAGESELALSSAVRTALKPLASLKLTVVLFALAIFIVLAGTFAQWKYDVWYVVEEYFRIQPRDFVSSEFPWIHLGEMFAWIEFQVFFPPAFFAGQPPEVPGSFPFPKGWVIGALMLLNLVAAHLVRFRTQAKDGRLWVGVGVLVVGAVATALVILSGDNKDGLYYTGGMDWSAVWEIFKALLVITGIGCLVDTFILGARKAILRWSVGLLGVAALGTGLYFYFGGESAELSGASLRILWQLMKAGVASLILLAGSILVFRKRAGVVLLHAGIGLMMISEVIVGIAHEEGQMSIVEGELSNYVQDIRTVELAVIDRSDSDTDQMTVVPKTLLRKDKVVRDEDLPFDVELVKYYENSVWRALKEGEKTPADAGLGTRFTAEPRKPIAGTDTGGRIDAPSAYVRLLDKESEKPIGTYLVGLDASEFLNLPPQTVAVDGTTYEIALRFKRTYKPYSVRLLDVRKEDYIGTDTPRDYSSYVHIVDETRGVDRDVRIWMNNPLRFAGATFYQSNYARDPRTGKEITTLQVVTNTGWMIPYVSCVIVAVGMLYHFVIVLLRFLNRRAAGMTAAGAARTGASGGSVTSPERLAQLFPGREGRRVDRGPIEDVSASDRLATWFPVLIVAVFGLYFVSKAMPPRTPASEFNYYEFGKIPLVYEGRVKPFDTLARNTLRVLSGRETFEDEADREQPAIRWLLDVVARPEAAEKHKVFRIENFEVLSLLELERVKRYRYSLAEMEPHIAKLQEQIDQARDVDPDNMSIFQRKALDLYRKITRYRALQASLQRPPFPTAEQAAEDADKAFERFYTALDRAAALQTQTPRTVADPEAEEPIKQWIPYSTAATRDFVWKEAKESPVLTRQLLDLYSVLVTQLRREDLPPEMRSNLNKLNEVVQGALSQKEPYPSKESLETIFAAYAEGDYRDFNREVQKYQRWLAENQPEEAAEAPVSFEAYFNHAAPFYYSAVLYLVAFVLAALAWLGWSVPLNRASFWLIAFTFVIHTLALIARIWISGRPPVTNLYSSAVFIGWGAVVLGMILELVYRLGIGNVIASVSGFATLLIAHMLAGDGDTFVVLQAVLDTQFWLATHVTTVTLGYATTYVAGLLGVLYILRGVLTPSLSPQVGKDLARMTYGTLCFAIFFSFVGTVLGGLWADDSWGRFWGWDPKENGALIIVLWNALVLHARWDGMVKERGLAVLAVGGNIVTSWSWFGVNELGVGLHSYGFTEGVLLALGGFIVSQLVIIAMGSLPKGLWWSFRERDATTMS